MPIAQYLNSSIGKKQIVAVTGLLLIGFVLGHLAGNLLIYGGPDLYNAYAKKLASLRPGLYLIEFGLLGIFVAHMYVTALLVIENIQARGQARYSVSRPVGERSWATRLMPYTGTFLLAFIIWHLLDFTFVDHHGPGSIVRGKELALYGVVYNAFADPWHSLLYVLAMFCLGLHLSHGIQSCFQTFGCIPSSREAVIAKISNGLGFLIAAAYSSLPIYVFFHNYFRMKQIICT